MGRIFTYRSGFCLVFAIALACGESAAPGNDTPGGSGSGGQAMAGSPATSGSSPTTAMGGTPGTPGGASSATAGTAASTAGAGGSAGTSGAGGGNGGAGNVDGGCNGKALCWDFEEGKIPDGFTTWREAGAGTLLVDDTKPFGKGKYSLHAKDLQGGPQHTLKYVLPASFGPVMWGRMRLYTTPTRPDAHAGFFNARYPKPGQPENAPENQLNWYEVASYKHTNVPEAGYMSIFHPPWPPGFPEDVQVSDTLLVLDRWTCVEWLFDGKNDADPDQAALPKMWLDGSELAWPAHFTYSEPAGAAAPFRDKVKNFTVIELGIVTWQNVPTPVSWWLDDVAIGTERIGCN